MSKEVLFWRFFNKVAIDDGCWEWLASRSKGGYGQFGYDGKMRRSHRVAYELLVGPIPEGYEIDHLCRNRGCQRPDHLEPVTHQENGDRRLDVDLGFIGDWQAAKTHCPKGHPYDEVNTYTYSDGSRKCRTCRREGMRKVDR